MTHPLLRRRGLYAITCGPRDDLIAGVRAALEGGAVMLQYRDKTCDSPRRLREARELAELCMRFDVPLIVNDDVALARASGADGVHLGATDPSIARAREVLGDRAIIGISCYDSLERARRAADAGADYLAFGAFFTSPTKPAARHADPRLLREARIMRKPLVAIGGITPDNGGPLITAGADYLSAISAVFDAPDVRVAARQFADLFDHTQTDR